MTSLTPRWRSGVAALASSLFLLANAHAGAPMIKTSAPGFYRMMLGGFEVTALSDGTLTLPVDKLLTNIKPGEVDKALARSYLKEPVDMSVNAFLINTGAKLVLVDTGTGKLFGPDQPLVGKLVDNLKAAGYQPEQVDEVYITHMHPDHIGGLMTGDKMSFPNAIVRADKADADYWLNQANMDKAPAGLMKDSFKGAMASLNPYVAVGKFKPFAGDTELVPGVSAKPAHGHTAGHSLYVIESKGEKMVLWGDLMHVAAVQFPDPSVMFKFDTDSKAAAAQRKKYYADAAKHGYWVGAAHLSFPGIGHLRREGKGYAWVPANYTVMH